MRKVRLFSVAPRIPAELTFLEQLARNMWWSWNQDAIDLFHRMDGTLWKASGQNPLVFLSQVSQQRLNALATDDAFIRHYHDVKTQFEEATGSLVGPSGDRVEREVAYFSLEYGIHQSVKLYAGGLGCLAGDHLKSMSDMRTPAVAVGLLYRHGYFRQFLNRDGWQQESVPENVVQHMPIEEVRDAQGRPVRVAVPMPDGAALHAAVWRLDVGRIPLYLLDANISENNPELRRVAGHLYDSHREVRLRQELLLGIGGYQALLALGYRPRALHMNEGHAAFAAVARVAHLMAEWQLSLDEAMEVSRRTSVFTTHTPVPAGNEIFEIGLLRRHLDALAPSLKIPTEQVLSWSAAPGQRDQHELTMTVLALRLAQFSNAVSKLHGEVTRSMWRHLWPEYHPEEVPIAHVTNGVHVASWLSAENKALFDRYIGPDWHHRSSDPEVIGRLDLIPGDELWRTHEIGRSRLIRMARDWGEKQHRARNATKEELAAMRTVLRPDTLTIGFARRFAAYKRAYLLLRDRDRFKALLRDNERPIQLVFAGKAHPADDTGKELIRQIIHFARDPDVRNRIVFLENYDIGLARYLVQGVDVWLNTPRRPLEASGTSGMKAAINGGINVSVLDGWWDEAYHPNNGWAVGVRDAYDNHDFQDNIEADALYNLLEDEILPAFYDREEDGLPVRWIAMMRESIRTGLGTFSSDRMVDQYDRQFYKAAAVNYERLTREQCAAVRVLAPQLARLTREWGGVRLGTPQVDRDLNTLHVGDAAAVEVEVHLGRLAPEDVEVQLYHGPVDNDGRICSGQAVAMQVSRQSGEGGYVYARSLSCDVTGRFGLTARALPANDAWRTGMPGFLTWADG